MARRTLFIGLLVVLAQLAMGCHKHCGGHRAKRIRHVDDCSCACSSPIGTVPMLESPEPLPAPKRMPAAATLSPTPVTVGANR